MKLTAAQLALLKECNKYDLCENYGRAGYIRLGGYGGSPLRNDWRVRNALEKHGLLEGGSMIRPSVKGKEYLANLTT